MKNFFIIVLLSFSGLAFAEATQCTIANYRDIVFQDNAEPPQCDLREADLTGANLRDADLRGADLRDARIWDTDLRFADLRDADLRGASFINTDLRFADFRGADLRGVYLKGAKNLIDANLQGADLRDAIVDRDQVYILIALGVKRFTSVTINGE